MSNTNTETKGMVTRIRVYDLVTIQCPDGMNIENCLLRHELDKLSKNELSGCDTLPNGDLIVPYYLPQKNENLCDMGYGHANSVCARICQECRNKKSK